VVGPPTVETCRLLLRAPTAADVDPLFEIQGDPRAMQFTFCAPDREATAERIAAYAARFAEDGFAPWTAVLRAEDRVAGWGGLNRDPEAPEWGPEVAYFIHPAYWGRGLATELVTASLDLAFRRLGLAEVGAFTKPENGASARVLRKTGFSFVRYVPELGRDQFAVARRNWRGAG
jgi:RimJ/RimL family protein N-acetyltransferase